MKDFRVARACFRAARAYFRVARAYFRAARASCSFTPISQK